MEREMRNAVLIGLGMVSAMATGAAAQCTPAWDRTPGNPSLDGYVGAMIPFNGGLAVSGSFTTAGVPGTAVLAHYDPATNVWSSIGGGMGLGLSNGFGTSFAMFNNDLVVGGFFHDAGGVTDTKSIARWDGTQWNSIVTGWNPDGVNSVWSMVGANIFGGNKVFFGGSFDTLNGNPAAHVGMWDGTTVTPIVASMPTLTSPAGSINPLVTAMCIHDDGMGGGPQLYIGGRFNSIDGQTILNVARWNGTTWSAVGTNLGNTIITAEVDALLSWNGNLYMGGSNMRVNGALQQTAKWDGTTWTAVGQNTTGRVWSLAAFNDGSGEKLYAGGTFAGLLRIARLEGNTWTTLGGGADASVFKILPHQGKLYVGGSYLNIGGQPAAKFAAWTSCPPCGNQDFNGDGDFGTDADIEAFFACLGGSCWPGGSDFNGDGDSGTDADIEAFFRVLGGGSC
jgi:hypothetical protein